MNDNTPGDLSIRIAWARVFGGGADQGKLKPSLEISDGTSRKTVSIALTAEQISELISGQGDVQVEAAAVSGFKAFRDFGKRHEHKTVMVKSQPGDYQHRDGSARKLPHVAAAIAGLEADGYRADMPRRNNSGSWVIIGRRYVEQ